MIYRVKIKNTICGDKKTVMVEAHRPEAASHYAINCQRQGVFEWEVVEVTEA
jgi:hypothetical protein